MQHLASIDLWLALGVVVAMALSDAVVVMFTSSIIRHKALAVANWSALSYTLSSFAVISFTNNWIYVVFAALGSWIGSYITMKYLHSPYDRADRGEHLAEELDGALVESPGDFDPARNRQPLPASAFPSGQRFAA